jgi:hypothetical protein
LRIISSLRSFIIFALSSLLLLQPVALVSSFCLPLSLLPILPCRLYLVIKSGWVVVGGAGVVDDDEAGKKCAGG